MPAGRGCAAPHSPCWPIAPGMHSSPACQPSTRCGPPPTLQGGCAGRGAGQGTWGSQQPAVRASAALRVPVLLSAPALLLLPPPQATHARLIRSGQMPALLRPHHRHPLSSKAPASDQHCSAQHSWVWASPSLLASNGQASFLFITWVSSSPCGRPAAAGMQPLWCCSRGCTLLRAGAACAGGNPCADCTSPRWTPRTCSRLDRCNQGARVRAPAARHDGHLHGLHRLQHGCLRLACCKRNMRGASRCDTHANAASPGRVTAAIGRW